MKFFSASHKASVFQGTAIDATYRTFFVVTRRLYDLERTGGARSELSDAVASSLATAIISGKYAPGHILADELTAAKQLAVSRTTYREALRSLIAKGMVSSQRKVGTIVRQRKHWNHLDPELLGWVFAGTPDIGFVRSLFEVRAAIEPVAASLAAQRRDAGQLARMELAIQTMERETLFDTAGQAADKDFHDALLEATGNEVMYSLSSGIAAAVLWTTVFKHHNKDLGRDAVLDHVAVFAAVRDQKPTLARRTMADLIRLALQDIENCISYPSNSRDQAPPGNH